MAKQIYCGDLHDLQNAASYKFAAVASCGVHINSEHITIRRKGRKDWHLLYVESGSVQFFMDDVEHTVYQGGFVIYPPGKPQRYEQNGGICYWVHFSGEAILEILTDAGLKNKLFLLKGKVQHNIIQILDRMIYRYVTRVPSYALNLASDLISLLAELGLTVREDETDVVDPRLHPVIVHIHKNYSRQINLEAYANMVNLSVGRFMHIFRQSIGRAPYAYILELRLTKAAELLRLSDNTVSETAYAVGFSNPLYFSRVFKKHFGVSPEQFRTYKQCSTAERRILPNSGCE